MKPIAFFITAFATMTSISINAQNTFKISLAGQTTDTISRQEIIANPVVAVIGTTNAVESFELSFKNINGDLIVIPSGNNQMTSRMLTVIRDNSVRKIYIENVVFTNNGNTVPSKRFYLKN